MCIGAMANATGGLVGGPLSGFGVLKSVFGKKKRDPATGAVTTAGTPGPSPSSINPYGGG
jgi:hypothetical protein